MAAIAVMVALLVTAACGQSTPPAPLDTDHEPCGTCRMVISDQRFASQLVAPNEEPRFFDDLGCLGKFLTERPEWPRGAVVYVADHRTRVWVRADAAVYTRVDALSAPMGSHFIAHESAASRDADPEAVSGVPVGVRDVFPGGYPPGDSR